MVLQCSTHRLGILQVWTRTRITTNSNSSQRPNKSIIKNFKNSKPLESSKHKKTRRNLDQNHHAPIKLRKQKKGGKKKEGNLPKPLPSFSFFRPFLSLLPTAIYINKKLKQTTRRRFSAFPSPSSRLKFYKKWYVMSPITFYGNIDPSPWNANRKL